MQKILLDKGYALKKNYMPVSFSTHRKNKSINSEALNDFIQAIEQSKKLSSKKSEKTPNDFGFQKSCLSPESIEEKAKKAKKEEGDIEKKVSSQKDDLKSSIDSLITQIKRADVKNTGFKSDYAKSIQDPASGFSAYERHSEVYRDFINSVLYDNTYALEQKKDQDNYQQEQSKEFKQGDEVMNYSQRKEYVKKLMNNAKFKNGLNHIDETEKKKYEYWKATDSLNLFMSFLMYENPCLYQ
ncbi:MAG: hypothetical protein ACOCZQ_03120 [Nanoarchaeota archaeon]